MPYPIIALAGLALSAAGTAASMQAQAKARSAVSNAQAAEAQRQSDYQKRANTVFQESLKTSGRDTAESEIEQGAQKRLAGYSTINAAAAPTATATPAATMNRVVTPMAPTATATANQAATTAAWNNIIGKAQSRGGGYADWGLNEAVRNRRAAEKLGAVNSAAQGSARVSQLEAENASHAGDSLAFIGDALRAGGKVGGYWGATRPLTMTDYETGLWDAFNR